MTTTTANLNLRVGAGTALPVLQVIPKGATVKISGDPWYQVIYDGDAGWVSGKFLDLNDAPTDTQTPYDDYVADAMALAKRMLGLYYKWGGNFTQEPFAAKRGDCSGYVGFVAHAMGYQPGVNELYNYSADSIYRNFLNGVWPAERIEPGKERAMDLVCYGSKQSDGTMKVTHIVYAVGDGRVIGSSGGFEATLTDADAKRVGAKVRYDPLHFHAKPIAGIFRPDYGQGR